jgi:hypothetical protein
MKISVRIALLASVCLLAATPINSGELLTMRASTFAPGTLTVRFTVETDADNRGLAVTAEGPAFYHSSQIQLDGNRAPRTTVFELRGLPTDVYEVRGILVGTSGPRARTVQLVRLLPERLKRRKAR